MQETIDIERVIEPDELYNKAARSNKWDELPRKEAAQVIDKTN